MEGLGSQLCQEIGQRVISHLDEEYEKPKQIVEAWKFVASQSTLRYYPCHVCGGPQTAQTSRPCFRSYCDAKQEDYICHLCGNEKREEIKHCTFCQAQHCEYCELDCDECYAKWCLNCHFKCEECGNHQCPSCHDHYCRILKRRKKDE